MSTLSIDFTGRGKVAKVDWICGECSECPTLAPTVADVERITALRDPVLRNLQITQCYCELSREFAARTGGEPANWCTFATWASKQAGQTIRKEDLRRAFERLFTGSPDAAGVGDSAVAAVADLSSKRGPDRIWDAMWPALVPDCAFERASDAVARGNRKVFEEIGREFARFLALPDESFYEGLRPGDPPDGQDYLRQAFTAYTSAFAESDPKARAELMLLANLAIGWHEQTRLQPEIAEALDAPFEEPVKLRRGLLRHLLRPRFGLALRLLAELLPGRRTRVKRELDELDRRVKQIAHEAVTDVLLTLSLPGRALRLGRDVPGAFPAELERIDNAGPARAARPARPHAGHHARQRRRQLVETARSNQLHRRPVSRLPARPEGARRRVQRRAGEGDQVRRAPRRPALSRVQAGGRAAKFTRSPLSKISSKRSRSYGPSPSRPDIS